MMTEPKSTFVVTYSYSDMMTEPKSTLVDVMNYLKSDEGGIRGTPTPTSMVKLLTPEDRRELRLSLDAAKGL